jgi:hypothetical protein
MEREADAKWVRVRNPDYWNSVTDGFNETNAKMVCEKCHREFGFDLKCALCGSSKLVLGTAAETPGIFCRVCHSGQWHWDCPTCGRRQDFASSFFYNKKAISIGARSRAA